MYQAIDNQMFYIHYKKRNTFAGQTLQNYEI